MLVIKIPLLPTGIYLAVRGTAHEFGGLVDGVTSEDKIGRYESNKDNKNNANNKTIDNNNTTVIALGRQQH